MPSRAQGSRQLRRALPIASSAANRSPPGSTHHADLVTWSVVRPRCSNPSSPRACHGTASGPLSGHLPFTQLADDVQKPQSPSNTRTGVVTGLTAEFTARPPVVDRPWNLVLYAVGPVAWRQTGASDGDRTGLWKSGSPSPRDRNSRSGSERHDGVAHRAVLPGAPTAGSTDAALPARGRDRSPIPRAPGDRHCARAASERDRDGVTPIRRGRGAISRPRPRTSTLQGIRTSRAISVGDRMGEHSVRAPAHRPSTPGYG